MKGSELIFRTATNRFIEGVTQEVMQSRQDMALSRYVAGFRRQIRENDGEILRNPKIVGESSRYPAAEKSF